tara:strand:- start:171 stop:470 length:300 start_codon:yes stop_codon:yes gene_type:complete
MDSAALKAIGVTPEWIEYNRRLAAQGAGISSTDTSKIIVALYDALRDAQDRDPVACCTHCECGHGKHGADHRRATERSWHGNREIVDKWCACRKFSPLH